MGTTNFSQRRENVLSVFNGAVKELNTLNADIDETMKANENTVAELQAQNRELGKIKSSNNKTIAFFSKIFKA